jgi:hypothetical protein
MSTPRPYIVLATCELKFNFDFYRPARASEAASYFFANAMRTKSNKIKAFRLPSSSVKLPFSAR